MINVGSSAISVSFPQGTDNKRQKKIGGTQTMKKKLLAIVLALALVSGLAFAMTACGGKGKFTVTFDANAPAAATAAVSGLPDKIEGVKKNAEIAEPAAKPALTGYDFGGWHKEAACTNAWSFTTDKVTASVTLYAKWTVKTTPAVTLAVPTGLSITSADVEDDNVYTLSWTAVENASGYTVGVGTAEHQVNAGESLDLTALELAAGVYDVRVLAKGNGTAYSNSAYSAVVRHYQGTEGLNYVHGGTYTETWMVLRGEADMDGKTVVCPSHYKGKAVGITGLYPFQVICDPIFIKV